jgi:hypothetical protein
LILCTLDNSSAARLTAHAASVKGRSAVVSSFHQTPIHRFLLFCPPDPQRASTGPAPTHRMARERQIILEQPARQVMNE